MSCLFCGKEIGPLRLLRKEEFCSPAHRQLYQERLGKVLGTLSAPEPAPARPAGFRPILRSSQGVRDSASHLHFMPSSSNSPRTTGDWPVAVPRAAAADRDPRSLMPTLVPLCGPANFYANACAQLTGVQTPVFALALDSDLEVEALRASGLRGPAPSLQPAPVARWVIARHEAEAVPATAAIVLPDFLLAPGAARPALCGAAPSGLPPAGPGRRSSVVLPFRSADRLPRFDVTWLGRLAAAQSLRPAPSEEWMPSPAPMPVARWVAPVASEAVLAAEVAKPLLDLSAALDPLATPETQRPDMCGEWMPSPAPMPVARWVAPVAGEALLEMPAEVAKPRFNLSADLEPLATKETQDPALCEAWMPPLAPMLVARFVEPGMAGAAPQSMAGIAAPRFGLSAALEPLPAPETQGPPACDEWMPPLAPMLVARMVVPSAADVPVVAAHAAAIQRPTAVMASESSLRLPVCGAWAPGLEAQAALVDAVPSMVSGVAHSGGIELPVIPPWQAKDAMRGPHAGPAPCPDPEPVESWPSAPPCVPVPLEISPRLALPVMTLEGVPGSARLECSAEPDMALRPALPAPAAAPVVAPMFGTAAAKTAARRFPLHLGRPKEPSRIGFIEPDLYCRPKPGGLSKRLVPAPPSPQMATPPMSLRPVFDRWEEIVPRQPAAISLNKVLTMPRPVRKVLASKHTRHLVGSVAAGFLAASIYLGASRPHPGASSNAGSTAVNETSAAAAGTRRGSGGALSRLRQAIADRAAASWSDSFHSGMESWGATGKSWSSGWSHSADGYVQPGSLAIFRPTSSYTDYQLEFFGQIERTSMDWVVRAKDSRNYYAMKLKVIESGLRPVVAMVHYNVANGKRQRVHELPLNVMVHNGHPMQVLVDVHGSHFTASIDGQQVDSWSDSAPSSGGVGFFAEAGEKARLYWMRVSRNQDFLGRICAYFTGSTTTAEVWPQNPGGQPRLPGQPVEAMGVALAGNWRRRSRDSRVRS